jgi:hypothetical protein
MSKNERKKCVNFRLLKLCWAIEERMQAVDAEGNLTAKDDTISCPALRKLCQDHDEVNEHLHLGQDQVTHLNECMFKEGDRHISRAEIAEIVMKAQTPPDPPLLHELGSSSRSPERGRSRTRECTPVSSSPPP